jgi:hypothetical protein
MMRHEKAFSAVITAVYETIWGARNELFNFMKPLTMPTPEANTQAERPQRDYRPSLPLDSRPVDAGE